MKRRKESGTRWRYLDRQVVRILDSVTNFREPALLSRKKDVSDAGKFRLTGRTSPTLSPPEPADQRFASCRIVAG